jgi:integrase
MPVTQRGKSWQATVHHQGARYRESFPTEAEAKAWELQTKAALVRGENLPSKDGSGNNSGPKTLQELFELCYQRFWKNSKSSKTAYYNAKKCIDTLGPHLPPSAVNEQRIDDMVFLFESEGTADSTINRRLSALSKMLTFALERGYILRKPKIDRKKEPEHRIRYITEEEEEGMIAYFNHIGQPDMADIVAVGVDTGMRRGEILKMAKRDLSDSLITLWETKGGKPRSIPLTTRAKEILNRRAEGLEREDKLFKDWTPDRIRHYWDLGRRHLGLMRDPQFIPHAMRHTFCSRLVQRGVDIVTVSKLAGHSSIQMTMRYAHLSPDNLVLAIKALGEVRCA